MTPDEWANANDPYAMLEFLQSTGRLTDRKARLFGVACCRRIRPWLSDESSWRAVEVAEQLADGTGGPDIAAGRKLAEAGFEAARVACHQAGIRGSPIQAGGTREKVLERAAALPAGLLSSQYDAWSVYIFVAAGAAAVEGAQAAAKLSEEGRCTSAAGPWSEWVGRLEKAASVVHATADEAGLSWGDWVEARTRSGSPPPLEQAIVGRCETLAAERRQAAFAFQTQLLRDLFSPFHVATLEPSCLSPSVLALAQAIYDEHAFDRFAELARALADAGCTDAGLLGHLKSRGPHARGCWALDAVLRRE
jgi:hypothetical protein